MDARCKTFLLKDIYRNSFTPFDLGGRPDKSAGGTACEPCSNKVYKERTPFPHLRV